MTQSTNEQTPIEFNHKLELCPKFQRACDEFVHRHVVHNASELIEFVGEHDPDNEDLLDVYYKPLTADDYRDQYSGEDKYAPKLNDGEYIVLDVWSDEQTQETFDCELEAWQHSYNEQNLDKPDSQEALEFWAVSNDLAHWLTQYDEAVNNDILGFAIWGRTTSGQAISMDSIIQRIYWDILDDNERASFIQKIGND